MKRNFTAIGLFLLVALMATINTANAQVEWGVTAGMNMANLTGKGYKQIPDSTRPKFSGITRYRFGIFADIPINNYWSMNPGINYSVIGGIQRLDSGYAVIDIPPGWADNYQSVSNFDFSYIELPLLMRFSTPLGNPTALYPYENSVKPFYLDLFAGIQPSYMISAKNDASFTFTRSSSDTTPEFNFSTKQKSSGTPAKVGKFDFGAVFGFGFKWRFNRKSYIYLDGRYTMHFSNINKGHWNRWVAKESDPTQNEFVKPVIKNAGTLSLSVGFITNFSKRRYFNLYKKDKNRPDGH